MTNHRTLADKIEEVMIHYSRLSAIADKDTAEYYFEGVAEGLNKAWKLLDGETVKNVKT
jgi:hypothetical protein